MMKFLVLYRNKDIIQNLTNVQKTKSKHTQHIVLSRTERHRSDI